MTKKKNTNLTAAKKAKNDEFYTQLTDIENEMEHYWPQFKDKTIFMNCDDPKTSWFWFYFAAQFEHLGIKKLISTHYDKVGPTYKMEVEKDTNGDGKIDGDDAVITPLKGNGDFRSPECVALLDESDIVITNPPFSLFREYVKQLMDHNKKFLIIGSWNAVTYKDFFPYIKGDRIWMGYRAPKSFIVPDSYINDTVFVEDGVRKAKFGNVCWYTNLDVKKRYEELLLYKKYKPEDFPTYDNCDAINVDDTRDIPVDYDGIMGVPITFIDKYNPRQFEILGMSRDTDIPGKTGMKAAFVSDYFSQGNTGQIMEGHPDLGYYDKNGKTVVPYRRIMIRRRPGYDSEKDD